LEGWSDDWKSFLLNVSGSNYADSYFLATEGQAPQFITTGRPNITADFINPIGKVTFKARDELKIPTILTIPKNSVQDMKNLPAILMPHGGPMAHDAIEFDWMAQALASQGYLVIQPQFRGSTGFGAAFESAGHGEWGGKMQDDLTDAVKFFVKKGYVDPHRICIVGASYGGYAALAGGAFTPDLYKCVVSINGISDLKDFYKRDKFEHGSNGEFARIMAITLANGEVDSKKLAQTSPIKFAKNFTAPVLLIHSELDSRVDIGQSKDMASELKSEKKSVKFIPLEGDDHHLSEGKTRKQALNAMIKFVNENLNK
jgi:dipeptidyl aminopeptidase/acylaminoacyl peptidase